MSGTIALGFFAVFANFFIVYSFINSLNKRANDIELKIDNHEKNEHI
jgi:F0F1-type ATP synthase membrane subunit b/b'